MSGTKRVRIEASSKVAEFLMDTICVICRVTLFEDRTLVTGRSEQCVKGCHALCTTCVMKLQDREGVYFSCPICRKTAYGTQDVLTSHLKSQMDGFAKEAIFFCKNCDTGFDGEEAYKRHIQCPTCGYSESCDKDGHSCIETLKKVIASMQETHRMKEKLSADSHLEAVRRLEDKCDFLVSHCQEEHGCDCNLDSD